MTYIMTFASGAILMLVSLLLVGICKGKRNEPSTAENGQKGKDEFNTVCYVMHLLRCGKVGRETPNWQVYSEVKKWKEVCDAD